MHESAHVMPSGAKWAVRARGAARALKRHDTISEARRHATAIARIVYIHDCTGRISERIQVISGNGGSGL